MKRIVHIYINVFLYCIISASIIHAEDIFDMADRMDKSDFADLIDNARSCASNNDFSCSESNLSKAKKLARSKKEKKQLADARNYQSSQKREYEAEQRRQAEQRRYAEQRERERQQASSASSSYGSSSNSSYSNKPSTAAQKGVKRTYDDGKYTYIVCNDGHKDNDKHWVLHVGGGKCTSAHSYQTNDCQYEIDSYIRHCEK